MDDSLLQVSDFRGVGYRPLVDFGAWRVAVLRYIDELLPQNIAAMQRHDATDEVFLLLAGRCILFIAEGGETVERITAVDMQPHKAYNVRRGAWHTHTLDRDAHLIIVENCDTGDANSPHVALTEAQRGELVRLTCELWGDWDSSQS
jgi:hypothetical protein